MTVEVKKVPGGLMVEGLTLRNGKCGCTSLASCCYSWSKVKKRGSDITFEAKMSGPDSKDLFGWSYLVDKDGVTVSVSVEDAADKNIYSGYFPPRLEEWESRGWQVREQQGKRRDGTVWRCAMCKWIYKEDEQETPFEELPDDWCCPVCGAPRSQFEKIT
jgi:rubredoxin